MNFGEKIKYRRQELGLSQTDIAKKIELHLCGQFAKWQFYFVYNAS